MQAGNTVKKIVKHIMPSVNGLGDVVHAIANPIAKAIDKTAGTNIQGCGGCQSRRQKLNQKFPMKTIAILFALLLAISSKALDFTYSTNLFYGLNYTTNIYIGTNGTDTNGWNFHQWAGVINNNDKFLESENNARKADIAAANFTNRVSTPYLLLTNYTVNHSTNLTTGLAAGTIAADNNYIYRVVGSYTNAIGTNWYRIAWDTNGW